jgi:hypothetical protein
MIKQKIHKFFITNHTHITVVISTNSLFPSRPREMTLIAVSHSERASRQVLGTPNAITIIDHRKI